jgi:hypothetical protein
VRGQRHAPAALYPGKDPVPIVQKAGWVPGPVWTGAENLASTGIRSPDRPARSQSLYRLSYPAPINSPLIEILSFQYCIWVCLPNTATAVYDVDSVWSSFFYLIHCSCRGLLMLSITQKHTHTHTHTHTHRVGLLWTMNRHAADASTSTQQTQETKFHDQAGLDPAIPTVTATADPRLRPRDYRERPT